MKLERMHSTSFDWQTWRSGSIADLGIPCRKECIINKGKIIKQYAIGYLESESLYCRPKIDQIAIMLLKDNNQFWFHLRKDEFISIFGDIL